MELADAVDRNQFEYMKSFAEQLDDFERHDGSFPETDTFVLGPSPKVFTDIGLPALPVTMNQRHVRANLYGEKTSKKSAPEDHLIPKSELEKLPEKIADPVAIIQDKRPGEYQASQYKLTVLVEMEINGKQAIVPVQIGGQGRTNNVSIDSSVSMSLHGNKDAIERLIDALSTDSDTHISVYYVNQKKAIEAIRRADNSGAGATVRFNGLVHKITDAGSPVKLRIANQTESSQFKKWFGNSAAVNEDGSPMVLYHQTPGDFSVFNTENPVNGFSDSETPNGIFFKTNDHDIGIDGSKQMAVYLSVQKPLRFKDREAARNWYIDHVPGYRELYSELEDKNTAFSSEMDRLAEELFSAIVDNNEQLMSDIGALEDKKIEEYKPIEEDYRKRLRNLLDDYFIRGNSGYDGIILDFDGQRRVNGNTERVTSYIVFKNTQVKSATDNIGTFDRINPDIRYSSLNYADIAESYGEISGATQRALYGDGTMLPNGKVARKSDTDKAARKILKQYSSEQDIDEVSTAMLTILHDMWQGANGRAAFLRRRGRAVS